MSNLHLSPTQGTTVGGPVLKGIMQGGVVSLVHQHGRFPRSSRSWALTNPEAWISRATIAWSASRRANSGCPQESPKWVKSRQDTAERSPHHSL